MHSNTAKDPSDCNQPHPSRSHRDYPLYSTSALDCVYSTSPFDCVYCDYILAETIMEAMSTDGDEEWSIMPTPILHFLPDILHHQRRIHDGHYVSATYPFIPLQTRGEAYISLLQPTWPSLQHGAIQGGCALDTSSCVQFPPLASGVDTGRSVTPGNIHDSTYMGSTESDKVVSDSDESCNLQDPPVSAGTRLAEEYLCFPLSATSDRNVEDAASEVSSGDHGSQEDERGGDNEKDGPQMPADGDVGDGWGRIVQGCASGEVSSGLQDGQQGDGLGGFLSHIASIPHPPDGADKLVQRPKTLSSEATKAVFELTERYLQNMTRILGTSLAPLQPLRDVMGLEHPPTHSVLPYLTRLCEELAVWDARLQTGIGDQTQHRLLCNRGFGERENRAALDPPTFIRYTHGQWKQDELDLLRLLITTSRGIRAGQPETNQVEDVSDGQSHQPPRDKRNRDDGVDWHWVCEEMMRAGTARSRHQVLCKAVEIGLKKPLIRRGKKRKRQVSEETMTES